MQDPPVFTAYSLTDEVWMVPCRMVSDGAEFEPLTKPFSEDLSWESAKRRHSWTLAEDEALKQLVEKIGTRSWSLISQELNSKMHQGVPIRQGKQFRERYFNNIDPNLVKGKWQEAENLKILLNQKLIGNKWSEIAKSLQGRTEN